MRLIKKNFVQRFNFLFGSCFLGARLSLIRFFLLRCILFIFLESFFTVHLKCSKIFQERFARYLWRGANRKLLKNLTLN